MFAGIGYGSGLCVGVGTSVFFGFACSLFSKQVSVRVHAPRVRVAAVTCCMQACCQLSRPKKRTTSSRARPTSGRSQSRCSRFAAGDAHGWGGRGGRAQSSLPPAQLPRQLLSVCRRLCTQREHLRRNTCVYVYYHTYIHICIYIRQVLPEHLRRNTYMYNIHIFMRIYI